MTDPVESLILDLVEWVGSKERTYQETMDAWRTSCPRLPVWEDAAERGLIEMASVNGRALVRPTPIGLAWLKQKRPHACQEIQAASAQSSAERSLAVSRESSIRRRT
jgi:hypothetical protein